MTQSYILKHVLTCPIMGSHGYIFFWNDFGVVQIFHGRFWRHHKRQTSPHSIRRHAYFFKTATLRDSISSVQAWTFFTLISWPAYLLTRRRSDTYLFATPPNNASLKVEYTKITSLTCKRVKRAKFFGLRTTEKKKKKNWIFAFSSMTFALFYAVKTKLRYIETTWYIEIKIAFRNYYWYFYKSNSFNITQLGLHCWKKGKSHRQIGENPKNFFSSYDCIIAS